MRFPNKINRYRDTTLFYMVTILDTINHPISISHLFSKVKAKFSNDIVNFEEALACLYAIGKIDINEQEEIYKCW